VGKRLACDVLLIFDIPMVDPPAMAGGTDIDPSSIPDS
jgi:hypothetical protein